MPEHRKTPDNVVAAIDTIAAHLKERGLGMATIGPNGGTCFLKESVHDEKLRLYNIIYAMRRGVRIARKSAKKSQKRLKRILKATRGK